MSWLFIALAAVVGSPASPRLPEGLRQNCSYLPQYRKLLRNIDGLPAQTALKLLYVYQADPTNDNPEGCDSDALDENISSREMLLVQLVQDKQLLPPRAVFHCSVLKPENLECNGVRADGTGQPNARAVLSPPTSKTFIARIDNRLPGSRLTALYRTTLDDVQVGRRPIKLPTTRPVTIAPSPYRTVVIAIVTGPERNRVRKFVWYP